jgi:hypothetical protein
LTPELSPDALILIGGVVLTISLVLLHHSRALAGRLPPGRRNIAAIAPMLRAIGRGSETGRPIHVSPGSGSIGGRATTVETVAGLLAAERVATEAARNGAPVLASSGEAVAHLALRGTVRQAYRNAGLSQSYDPETVQLVAHQDALAYAAGVTALYGRQPIEASQMVGSFGDEFILIGESGAQQQVPQLVGAVASQAQPLVYLTTSTPLIGEEVYAAEAYLARSAAPQARLLTHDILRQVVIALIVVLIVVRFAGIPIGL